MNPNTQFERDLEQWLQAEAPASAPAGFHATVMDHARRLRQQPAWATALPVRRLGRGRGLTLLAAAALLGGGAIAAGSGVLRLPSVVPPEPSPGVVAVPSASPVAVATASPDATSPSATESAAPTATPIPVADPGGLWIPTGSMSRPRAWAVRLLDGRVLAIGGSNAAGDDLRSAELYDPATGTWSPTGAMIHAVDGFPPTLLRDGTVLAGDGVYNPASETWTEDPSLTIGPVAGETATVLKDGKVLVFGYTDAQLYDPASGTWTATGKKNFWSYPADTAATLLSDGKVLVAGGFVVAEPHDHALDSAEVYDPLTGSWTAIANMQAPHSGLTATLLRDGKVLVTGADQNGAGAQGVAEIYDPAAGSWTALPVTPGISFKTAALLSDGTVLVTGDRNGADQPGCTAAELYDPGNGSWTSVGTTLGCRAVGSLTPLLDGTVLVTSRDGSSQRYVPAGVALPTVLAPIPSPTPSPPPTPTPEPTAIPTPLPPEAGPVPPNPRSWTVTIDNRSGKPAALFVADEALSGSLKLVGSASPNVVPAGATRNVIFLFPAAPRRPAWIYVNPQPGEMGPLVNADDIGIPGKIVIWADGQVGWLSP